MAIPSEESVSVKRASKPGEPTEISINCPDKVGLGCDVARIIYEFGLSVVRGDLFTDGKWCFLVFWVVARIPGARGIKWSLLKHRLTAVCPSNDPILLPAIKPAPKKREVYLVQVCSSDRFGLLNDVTQVLWEAEVTIQRVNASTSPDGRAVDLFFITDNRNELPAMHRVEDLCERLRRSLGDESAMCEICAATPESGGDTFVPASFMPSSVEKLLLSSPALEEASPAATPTPGSDHPSWHLQEHQHQQQQQQQQQQHARAGGSSNDGTGSSGASPLSSSSAAGSGSDNRGLNLAPVRNSATEGRPPQGQGSAHVVRKAVKGAKGGGAGGRSLPARETRAVRAAAHQRQGSLEWDQAGLDPLLLGGEDEGGLTVAVVGIDNSMSAGHSALQITARDRKGLIFDCLRTLRDLNYPVGYGRITTEGGVCFLNIFIQDAKGRKLYDERKQRELVRRLRTELEEPIGVGVATTGPDSELLVSTPVERCGRGRPRVLYDVTYVLAQLGLQIFKGDITRHQLDGRQYEVYRFLLLDREGQPVADEHVQADIAAQVRNILMG